MSTTCHPTGYQGLEVLEVGFAIVTEYLLKPLRHGAIIVGSSRSQ